MATYYWVGGSGTWDNASSANWALTSGGAAGAGIPNAADTAVFDGNSGAAATVTVASTATAARTVVNKLDINISLAGNVNLSATQAFAFTAGALTLNNNTLTCLFFSSANANARSIAFGTGKIVITGNNTTVLDMFDVANYSYSGTPRFDLSYAGSTGTRIVRFGDNTNTANAGNVPDIYVTAGADTVRFFTNAVTTAVRTLDTTGFSGSIHTDTFRLFGSLNLSATTVVPASANAISFVSTQTGNTITTNGVVIDRPVTFNGVGGEWKLSDALTVGATRTVTLTNGTLDGNGKNATLGNFALGAGTKTLTLGSGTWTVAGTSWNANTNVANLTVSAATGIISMTSASAKTFAGGGKTWPTLNQGGAGALTIQQANTFANITNTVQPATIAFPASTTTTVGAFGVSGTSGNLITLNSSTSGTRATLSDASGVNSVSFCDIKDINATGGAFWRSYTSAGNVDSGNNVGWDFDEAVFRYIYTRRKNKVILPF